jgi:hypothetical protein
MYLETRRGDHGARESRHEKRPEGPALNKTGNEKGVEETSKKKGILRREIGLSW